METTYLNNDIENMDKKSIDDIVFVERIAAKAARKAIDDAHREGQPVYGSHNGALAQFRPDGSVHVLQEADVKRAEIACMSDVSEEDAKEPDEVGAAV